MKKILTAFVLALALAGCASGPAATSATVTQTVATVAATTSPPKEMDVAKVQALIQAKFDQIAPQAHLRVGALTGANSTPSLYTGIVPVTNAEGMERDLLVNVTFDTDTGQAVWKLDDSAIPLLTQLANGT
ncbi:MAG: hypothetical protein JWR46_1406 [Mycobacterium sp.]|nr:hypothetical protein [Mycobacterium sp.]